MRQSWRGKGNRLTISILARLADLDYLAPLEGLEGLESLLLLSDQAELSHDDFLAVGDVDAGGEGDEVYAFHAVVEYALAV